MCDVSHIKYKKIKQLKVRQIGASFVMKSVENKKERKNVMTITLLDLYNTAASQEWAMYDNDAESQAELEESLIIDLNKALMEIIYSYPFNFRERTHVLFTQSRFNSYDVPKGLILKDDCGNYRVRINSNLLKRLENLPIDDKMGIPEFFYIQGDKIILYPTPCERYIVTIDYLTLAIGENAEGEDVYALKNQDDSLLVPEHLEELLKNAVISRAMLNSIASENDENYSAYKKQSETAYKLLVKYSKGAGVEKSMKI